MCKYLCVSVQIRVCLQAEGKAQACVLVLVGVGHRYARVPSGAWVIVSSLPRGKRGLLLFDKKESYSFWLK